MSKILAVSKLPNGTGQAATNAVLEALDEWELEDRVKTLSFITNASNTGLSVGVCTIIEQRFEQEL